MTSIEFIKSRLAFLADNFPGIHLEYALDTVTGFHIIEVSPEDIRRGNENFITKELDFIDDFYKYYPQEDILISEPSSLNEMNNLLFAQSSNIGNIDTEIDSYNETNVCEYNNLFSVIDLEEELLSIAA